MKNITIIGSGAYGTAMASVLIDNGHNVTILGIDKGEIDDISVNHRNTKYFPTYKLSAKITATSNWKKAFTEVDVVVVAVPSKFIAEVCLKINRYAKKQLEIINVAKGLDSKRILNPYSIYENELHPNSYTYIGGLYGPSISSEVLLKQQICLTAVSDTIEHAEMIKDIFDNDFFVVKTSTEIMHVEFSVILKNAYAIVCGIASKVFSSKSSMSSIIAIAILEIQKIISIYSESKDIYFDGPSLADIILTTTSDKSRNFQFGVLVGEKDNAKQILETLKTTTEGINTCKLLCEDLALKDISLPLLSVLYSILFNNKKPSVFLKSLFHKLD